MAESGPDVEETVVEEATHLDEQLDANTIEEGVEAEPEESTPHSDPGSGDGSQDGGSGVEEALRAWEAGGHAPEELDEDDQVRPVRFGQLEETEAPPAKPRVSRLNNVYIDIIVELGRKEMTVRELTNLKEQEVVELDKLAGESFDILVNDRPFAEGEIVVITDMMAVRLTKMVENAAVEDEFE